MNILFCHLTAGYNIFGGVERSIINLALELSRQEHRIVLYTGRNTIPSLDGPTYKSISFVKAEYLNIPTYCDNFDDTLRRLLISNAGAIVRELNELFFDGKFDAIIAVDQLWGVIPFLNRNSLNTKAKFVMYYHMSHSNMDINRSIAFGFDHYLAVSDFVASSISRVFPSMNGKIEILPNCISDKNVQLKPIQQRKPFIFCNARMSPEKGVHEAVQAFKEVSEIIPLNLKLCGGDFHFGSNAPVLEEIRQFIDRNPNISRRIDIEPRLTWKEADALSAEASMVLVASKEESFGLAALEAMNVRTPIVSTRAGNLGSLLDGVAIFSEDSSPANLAEAISRCFRSIQDGSIEGRLETGLRCARKFQASTVASDLIKALSN
ncbi:MULTISPECIES: glycosyltransferase family 4 protein [Hyphobacterium]|uniref:Glycosyltransferase family 4 protein n=1 Tax=Hyphobacterium vulgare TaxID=1736751 RepID=A0ABV6ZX01_9PROT